jgi:hypothetical protein
MTLQLKPQKTQTAPTQPNAQKHANKQEFIKKFADPKQYIETALSKITNFDPIHITISDSNAHFNIFLTYHTQNNESVNECVFGSVNNEKIVKLISIYDLEETTMPVMIDGSRLLKPSAHDHTIDCLF